MAKLTEEYIQKVNKACAFHFHFDKMQYVCMKDKHLRQFIPIDENNRVRITVMAFENYKQKKKYIMPTVNVVIERKSHNMWVSGMGNWFYFDEKETKRLNFMDIVAVTPLINADKVLEIGNFTDEKVISKVKEFYDT